MSWSARAQPRNACSRADRRASRVEAIADAARATRPRSRLDEYATNCMLDLMVRSGRIDEARAWATELLADADFLAGKDDLRDTLDHGLRLLRPQRILSRGLDSLAGCLPEARAKIKQTW